MAIEAPLNRWKETIRPEWTDYNGHMNVAYFTLIFDHATDVFYPLVGLGKPYRARTGKSTFAVECHISYIKEVSVGDEVYVTTQLLGFDEKRIYYFHEMRDVNTDKIIATLEQLAVHVNLEIRKVEPMTEDTQRLLAQAWESHKNLSTPRQVGSVMSLAGKKKD